MPQLRVSLDYTQAIAELNLFALYDTLLTSWLLVIYLTPTLATWGSTKKGLPNADLRTLKLLKFSQ